MPLLFAYVINRFSHDVAQMPSTSNLRFQVDKAK